jgi:DNA-binding SARP family transcriptional activator
VPDASGPNSARRDRVEIGVLGSLRVHRGGQVMLIGSVKQRPLLGTLALHPDRVVGQRELIEVLWRADPPRSCHGLIHTYVARLRRLLEPSRARTHRVAAPFGAGQLYVDLRGYAAHRH